MIDDQLKMLGAGANQFAAGISTMSQPLPLDVAVIEPVGGHGGMDFYDFGLCEGLGRAGADVVLYTCDETAQPSSDKFICRRPFRKIFGDAPGWVRGLRYLSGTFKALIHALADGRKVVHFHLFNVGWLQIFVIGSARLLMRRVVVTAHDVECFFASLDVPMMNRWGYRLAHRVIAHNDISRQELIQRLGVNPDKIDVIPHGNYLQGIDPLPAQESARKQLDIPKNAKVLLFFGQIKEVKGLDVLLRAMPAIIEQFPDAVLLIAGKPWRIEFSHYQHMMEDLNIAEHCVSHIRYIHNDEVSLYYAASDLVVLPYQRIYQSGVVLMAMSFAKAVLASDIPGMLEVVSNDETGFVFRNGDAADLAHQVCRIFTDPERCEQVAAQGLALMKQKYDWTVIGKQTLASYRACMGFVE